MPEGLHKQLVWIKNQYNNPPVIITENGYADDGRLNDLERIDYMKVKSVLLISKILAPFNQSP